MPGKRREGWGCNRWVRFDEVAEGRRHSIGKVGKDEKEEPEGEGSKGRKREG